MTWNTVKAPSSFFEHIGQWWRDAFPSPRRADGRRLDQFQNAYLGYGTSRDKLAAGMFALGCQLTDQELHAMYYGDDVCARICNDRPAEMFRRGYNLRSKKNPARAEALQKLGKALELDTKILRGKQWAAWKGGAITFFGANDGQPDLSAPLNEKRITDTKFVNTVDRQFVAVHRWQDNPALPDYGMPEVYEIGSTIVGRPVRIHRTRVLRFDGVPETDPMTRRLLGGWTYSALQRPYDVIRKFATSYEGAAQLMADASQGVWKIQGLLDVMSSDRDAVLTRLALADMTRSAGRALFLDKEDEEFSRVATSFAGMDAVLDRFMMRLAAAADMPVTRLMGRSAAGMNATGEGDTRDWYDSVATEQKNQLAPMLIRAYTIIGADNVPDDLEVEFHPLWEPTAAEKATTYKTNAEADKVYNEMGVPAAAIIIGRFGSGEGKIEIDEAAFQADLKAEYDLIKDPEARAEKEAEAAKLVAMTANPNAPKTGEEGGDDGEQEEEEQGGE